MQPSDDTVDCRIRRGERNRDAIVAQRAHRIEAITPT
jgi:hypothetical protein